MFLRISFYRSNIFVRYLLTFFILCFGLTGFLQCLFNIMEEPSPIDPLLGEVAWSTIEGNQSASL